ncbi:MAG: hypothetical protein GX288_10775 [Clostridiales bacterium]|nr:hypothetical protein [Clostridiales bacterium]
MKEKLFTIPVNDAFKEDCECPICSMRDSLERDLIDFTMGPSYMEDDIRAVTSKLGFCREHIQLLYKNQNRLGLALILKSHLDKTIKDVEKLSGANSKLQVPSFFKKKKPEGNPLVDYLNEIEESCYICSRMETTIDRYIATVFYLYHNEDDFRERFKQCKGFCNKHYKMLYDSAPQYLKGDELDSFVKLLNKLYLDNMKRLQEDLEWFINKFDYRYADEPWKNAKDALPRAIQKINGIVQ